MRPNLSPFENGAYGTPFKVVSEEAVGPHESSDGRAEMISEREIGAMIATGNDVSCTITFETKFFDVGKLVGLVWRGITCQRVRLQQYAH